MIEKKIMLPKMLYMKSNLAFKENIFLNRWGLINYIPIDSTVWFTALKLYNYCFCSQKYFSFAQENTHSHGKFFKVDVLHIIKSH